MTDRTKEPLPKHIADAVDEWRAGLNTLPKSYIDFHKTLANRAVEGLKSKHVIHNMGLMPEIDGMQTLMVIAENRDTEELVKLQWNDGSQSFFITRLPVDGVPKLSRVPNML